MAYCRFSNSDFYIFDSVGNFIQVYSSIPDSIPNEVALQLKSTYKYNEIPALIETLKELQRLGASISNVALTSLEEDYKNYQQKE